MSDRQYLDGLWEFLPGRQTTDDRAGEHHVEVHFQNMHKNSVLNPHFVIEVR